MNSWVGSGAAAVTILTTWGASAKARSNFSLNTDYLHLLLILHYRRRDSVGATSYTFIKPSKLKRWHDTLAAFSPFPLPTRPQQTVVWVKRTFSTQCRVTIYYIVKCVMLTIKFHQHKNRHETKIWNKCVYCICKYNGVGLKMSPQDMYRCVTGQSSDERSPRRCIWSWTCSRRTAACLCICRTSPVCGAAWGQRGVVSLRRNNVLCCKSRKKKKRDSGFSHDTSGGLFIL